MLITTQTRYAVMSLVYLTERRGLGNTSLKQISQSQSLDLGYLEQIFNHLKNAQIVDAARGPGGGYKLSKDPSKVTLKEVLELFQDTLNMNACNNPKVSSCSGSVKCNSHGLWKYLGMKLGEILDEITILDIHDGKYSYE